MKLPITKDRYIIAKAILEHDGYIPPRLRDSAMEAVLNYRVARWPESFVMKEK